MSILQYYNVISYILTPYTHTQICFFLHYKILSHAHAHIHTHIILELSKKKKK